MKTSRKVLEGLLQGKTNREIAQDCGIAPTTVKVIIKCLCAFVPNLDPEKHHTRVCLAMWAHKHREFLGITCTCDH